jgi:hypothetical protein
MAVAKTPVKAEVKPLLERGSIVNLEKGGRTLTGLEVLDWDENFVKFRWNITISPQTEIVLIPWVKIEAIGLVNER